MLKSAFGAVKCITGNLGGRSAVVSKAVSNIRRVVTTRAVLNKDVNPMADMQYMVKPENYEKYILVIAGVYKNPRSVPDRVSHQRLKRAYDIARGRAMLAMIAIWTVIFLYAMQTGRDMREAGYSLEKEGLAQMAKLQEQGRQEREAAAKKAKA